MLFKFHDKNFSGHNICTTNTVRLTGWAMAHLDHPVHTSILYIYKNLPWYVYK